MNRADLNHAILIKSSCRHASFIKDEFFTSQVNDNDFSGANLSQSYGLTSAHWDAMLSISKAVLPDGSIGKNKNLIRQSHPN
ncbi:hypothetical protein I4U23_016182 [Adineta vaga]|nr:hypothetical protein I4U23_016182 [Adineta vaga]